MFKVLPSIDGLLKERKIATALKKSPRYYVVAFLRNSVEDFRKRISKGEIFTKAAIVKSITKNCLEGALNLSESKIKRVINGTGILLHSNLGRSRLSENAAKRVFEVSCFSSSLEFDLNTGKRGSRHQITEDLLVELTGAESAVIVNNNAASVMIMVNTFAKRKETLVSRGQMVEIGESFRIPDVLKCGNTRMVEVGTTNKTHLSDYEKNISLKTAMLLYVHTSNYRIKGFASMPDESKIATLAKQQNLVSAFDLGSGVLTQKSCYGIKDETTVKEAVKKGFDLVSFSGDKMIGGPQCGIIVGKKSLINKIRKNPMMRALRCGKGIYAALEETLKLFLDEKRLSIEHPLYKKLLEKDPILKLKGKTILTFCSSENINVVRADEEIGAGAMPLEKIKGYAIEYKCSNVKPQKVAAFFRDNNIPIIGYINDGNFFIDLRTLDQEDLAVVGNRFKQLTDSYT